MQFHKEHDAYSLCRACLQSLDEESINSSTIKHDIFQAADLAKKFVLCTSLNCEPTDGLPKYLCDCCYNKLNDFHIFQAMCMESAKCLGIIRDTPKIVMPFDDEKPEFDLVTQPKVQITISEPKLFFQSDNFEMENAADLETQTEQEFTACEPNVMFHSRLVDSENEDSLEKNDGFKCKKSSILQCDVCPSRFVAEHRLIAHKRDHDGLVPYPCPRDECKRGFRNWEGISEHLKKHDARNLSIGCAEEGCEKVFSSQRSLASHQRSFHRKNYICETCGKGYRTIRLLNEHSYSHKDYSEFPHVCEQCNRRFIQKRSLKEHLLRHAGIKNFICPHCGEGKTTNNELKYHINNHTLERRWPCRLCTFVFNKAVNLNRHIRTVHELVKNYACRYCKRSFSNSTSLKSHELIHTDEKPHECQECGKRFRQITTLRTHEKKMHQRFHKATTTRSLPLVTIDYGV